MFTTASEAGCAGARPSMATGNASASRLPRLSSTFGVDRRSAGSGALAPGPGTLQRNPGSGKRVHEMNRKSGLGARGRRSSSANPFTPRSQIPRRSSSIGDLRFSLASGAGSVRSAFRGNPGSARSSSSASAKRLSHGPQKTIKDTRPLTDKNFQAECTTKLSEFLLDHGYANKCTSKELLRMSSKDFEQIFQFLVSFLDPAFTITGKMEDSVLLWLKRCGYPFALSKSMLMGIGSRLPQALAVLMWLYDCVVYSTEVNIIDHLFKKPGSGGNDDTLGNLGPADLMRFCLDNPDCDEDKECEYLRSLAGQVPQDDDELDKLIEKENEVLAEMEARVERYDAVAESLTATKEKLSGFDRYFEDMTRHCEVTKKNMEETSKSLADTDAEKVMLKAELCECWSVLKHQMQKQEDEVTLRAKMSELQSSGALCRNQVDALKEELHELQLNWTREQDKTRDMEKKAEQLLKSLNKNLDKVLPSNQMALLNDFDLRPACTEEDLQHAEARNDNASATLSNLMSRTEERLRGHIKKDKELVKKYEYDSKAMTMELRSEQRIAEMGKAHAEARMKELELEIASKYEEFEKVSSEIAYLKAQKLSGQRTLEQTIEEKQKRLNSARRELEHAEREHELDLKACQDKMESVKEMSKEMTRHHMQMLTNVYNKVVADLRKLKEQKKILKKK